MYHITKDYMAREYVDTTSSRQRMEAMRKQEDYQSKFTGDMHNFYHGSCNGVNSYVGNNQGSENFTPKRHIRVGNFSPHVRSYEHDSYDCYEGTKLGDRNYYNDRSYERAPRNEVRNGGNYVKMDENIKVEGMLKDTMIIMIIMSIAMVVGTCIMSIMIVIAMEGIIVEEVLKFQELHLDILVTKI